MLIDKKNKINWTSKRHRDLRIDYTNMNFFINNWLVTGKKNKKINFLSRVLFIIQKHLHINLSFLMDVYLFKRGNSFFYLTKKKKKTKKETLTYKLSFPWKLYLWKYCNRLGGDCWVDPKQLHVQFSSNTQENIYTSNVGNMEIELKILYI